MDANPEEPYVVPPRGAKTIEERIAFLEQYYKTRCQNANKNLVTKEEKKQVVLEYALSIYLDFFRKYLATRQLEIAMLHTPYHTMVRFLRKRRRRSIGSST